MTFVLSCTNVLPRVATAQYLSLTNPTTDGNSTNYIFGTELDTVQNSDVGDIDDNHVGININNIRSNKSSPAAYFANEDGGIRNLTLRSGEMSQAWVEYDGIKKKLNVTLSPINLPKPTQPLISMIFNLSPNILDSI